MLSEYKTLKKQAEEQKVEAVEERKLSIVEVDEDGNVIDNDKDDKRVNVYVKPEDEKFVNMKNDYIRMKSRK